MATARSPPIAPSALSGLIAELRPRWKELRYSLHLLRKSLLAMVGLVLVSTFLFLAVFGEALAPYPYRFNPVEANSPPGTRPLIPQIIPELPGDGANNAAGPGWNSSGVALSQAVRYNDSLSALSDTVGETMQLERFPLDIYTSDIGRVAVFLVYNATSGSTGDVLNVSVSWDGGMSWSPVVSSPFRAENVNRSWIELDFSDATEWTPASLGAGTFLVRVSHGLLPGAPAGGVVVNAVRVVVEFFGNYHFLGTTVDGEDVLTGLLLGARISVRIGIIVVLVAGLIGTILGAIAGYFGGLVDELVMRITDVFLSIPGLILALAVAAALGRSLDTVMYALIVVYWPPYTRLVRAQALSVRENLYIEASRATGSSELGVVFRHVLWNTISPVLVQASLDAGSVVLVAAGLSFLGLGAQAGTPEWGLMVSRGFQFFPEQNWWQVTFAGLMIFLFVLGFNLLGDGVRDILDPRIRR